MADTTDSKSVSSNRVWVQISYPAPINIKNPIEYSIGFLFYIQDKFTYNIFDDIIILP